MTRILRSSLVCLGMLMCVGTQLLRAQVGASAASATQAQPPADSGTSSALPPSVRPLTDEDRRAAFPDAGSHSVHDPLRYFVLFDQLEWQAMDGGSGVNVDATGWIGRARNRLWFRLEGGSDGGRVHDAKAHVLIGRQISRWWDVVGGVRQDVEPGPAQTWAAIGVQGLAPFWFDIDATAYVGASGRTQARVEVEYELLVTNRLILQPRVEANVFSKSDPARGIGAGLSTTDVGLRLRYELKREVAPYVGVNWRNTWGETTDLADMNGRSLSGARLVVGVRFWQ